MSKSYSQPFDRKIVEEFGIGILTGEACAYSMRLLCDVNEDGVELINKAFGMNHVMYGINGSGMRDGIKYCDSMMRRHNSQVNSKPSVASIMLSHTQIDELVKFGIVERHIEQGEFVIAATPREGYSIYFSTPKRLYWLLKRIAKSWFNKERKLEYERTYRVNSFMWGGTKEEFEERFMDGDYFHDNWNYRRYFVYEPQPRRGSMNVHAMSGRAP